MGDDKAAYDKIMFEKNKVVLSHHPHLSIRKLGEMNYVLEEVVKSIKTVVEISSPLNLQANEMPYSNYTDILHHMFNNYDIINLRSIITPL